MMINKAAAAFALADLPADLDAEAVQRCIEAIVALPAVDAVEVVRCKDCVYYNSDSEECLDEMGYARAWHKNDYCSYGRKEDEG